MNNKRPFIIIPTRLDLDKPDFYLKRYYSDAVYAARGTPVLVPLIPDPGYIEELVSRSHGVVLPGSNSDIDPTRYGQGPHPKLGSVVKAREEVDQLMLAAAERRGLPVLAICFGLQSLNVYRRGTLIQDIPSQIETNIQHEQWRNEIPYGQPSHNIKILDGSLLAELARGAAARVNSHHHQAIDRLGQGLEPIAWASDGIVEAVVNTASEQFILGVQWHPEAMVDVDDLAKRLFESFIAQARGRVDESD
jgi:putative glutamine amidotransferase